MAVPRSRNLAMLVVACATLAGCGGGGGGGGSNPPSGSVTVAGTATFDRPPYNASNVLDFANLVRLPIRGATVEVLRASDQSVLARTTSSSAGHYSVSVSASSVIVRVKAQLLQSTGAGFGFEVRNNTAGNALYVLDSSPVTLSGSAVQVDVNAPAGWGGTSYTGTRAAAPFAILDVLWQAKELLRAAEPGLSMPALNLYWSPSNDASQCVDGQPDPASGAIGTTFFIGNQIDATAACPATPPGIYVLGDANGTNDDDSDEFDSSVIAHELGHYFQYAFSRDESMGGPHYLDARHDLTLSFSEGWGNAFQGFVLDDAEYRDTFGTSGNLAFAFDMENNSAPYTVATGFFSEASVHEFLWDVYDGVGDDQINLGYPAIHDVMRQDMQATSAFTSVFSFAAGLESRNPAQQAAIVARLTQENINGTGAFATNQTLPGATDLLPVYTPVTFGVPVTVTSTNRYADVGDTEFQSYNRLGSHRYLTIELPAPGGLGIIAQGPIGSDPDFMLFKNGVGQCGNANAACYGLDDSVATGIEEANFTNLAAGTYVLDVAECSYLGLACRGPAFGTNTAITVTVVQQ